MRISNIYVYYTALKFDFLIEVTKFIVFYKPYAINQCRVFPQCLHIGHPLLKHRLYGILCMWTNIFYIICESILTNSHPWELSKPWRNTNPEKSCFYANIWSTSLGPIWISQWHCLKQRTFLYRQSNQRKSLRYVQSLIKKDNKVSIAFH